MSLTLDASQSRLRQTAWDGQEQIQTNLRVQLSALSSPWLVCLLCADLSLEVMMRLTAGLLGTATNDRDHCALYSRQVHVQSRFYDNILWIFYDRLRTCKVSLLNIKYWVDNLNFAQISELANYSPADYRSQVVMTNTKYNWLPEKIISGSKY